VHRDERGRGGVEVVRLSGGTADSLVMLHGEDARHLGAEHANAAPGVAYLSGLGRDCERIRVPHLGDYGDYCDRIARDGRRAPDSPAGGAA
jgi:hypothetical protein